MNKLFKSGNVVFLVLMLTIPSCISTQNENDQTSDWAIQFVALKKFYQSTESNVEVSEYLSVFRSQHPRETQNILDKINRKEFENWFKGEDNGVLVKLKQSFLKEIEAHSAIFKDSITLTFSKTGEENIAEKLLLIEKMVRFREDLKNFNSINFEGFESAVSDINSKYPEQYKSKVFLDQLELLKEEYKRIEQQLLNSTADSDVDLKNFVAGFSALKKEALLSNPSVRNHPIVFVTRHQYAPDHHNSATLFHTNEVNTEKFAPGGSMKIMDLKKGGKITTLLESKEGVIRDPEISYDGKKILFSMRKNIEEDYHIYEMDIDSKNLKQLTAATGVTDIDPQYLPSGEIVFSSTREPKYCMCNIHIMANLFKMESDGANITQLGKSTLFEGHSSVLPDGRILYDRWEYIDRNFGDAQGLWTMNPDGTNQAIYFGNNTNSPGGFIDARSIPGTDKVISILGSCHDRPWGALGIIDRKKGIDGKESVETTWPASAKKLIGKGNYDTFKRVRPFYEDPFPLNENYFLCSRSIGIGEQMGLFLIDIFGNEQLIHTEAPGCYDPVPIRARNMEYSIEDKRNYKSETGKFYVQDVYKGTHMKGVEQGTVKYMRVIESVEKRSWTVPAWNGQGVHRPAMNWHSFECKKIWGTVPVEEDGSVYVEVPADKYVYFQLLDEDKMMVQSMRSGTMVHSGETMGCVGCHDDRRSAPPTVPPKVAQALMLPPQKLNGWYGEPRTFGFAQEVQPVLDKNCVECHDYGKKAGEKLILSGDRNPYFNSAYIDMYLKKVIKPIGAGPAEIQEAYSWGSHPSKVIQMLKKGHAEVKLSDEEMERLITWIDLNAVYYPDFISAYPDNTVGRSPISQKDLNRLGKLTNTNFAVLGGHNRKLRAQITFERPALSPCLKNIKNKNSDEYKEALSIITKGKNKLAQTPRIDMDGFIPSEIDKKRVKKYMYRQEEEKRSRAAILEGDKHYDPELVKTK